MKGLKTTISSKFRYYPHILKTKQSQNPTLSSIAITVLYSASFADGESYCQMADNNKTCIISDKNTTNTIILFPKTDQTIEVTG